MLGKNYQKTHLEILSRNGGFEFTDTFFPYTSGKIGPYFVHSENVMRNGADFFTAINDMGRLFNEFITPGGDIVISGGEKRDWIFSMPVAALLVWPHSMIFKDGKIIGANIDGLDVVHIADTNNEGSSLRDYWIPAIKKAGGNIRNILFYVDRLESGSQVVRDMGLMSDSLVPLNSYAWQCLKEHSVVNEMIYHNIMKRMEDREAWARRMLRSEKGLERLAEIYQRTPEKIMKILNVGYPDLKDELTQRLTGERGIVIAQ